MDEIEIFDPRMQRILGPHSRLQRLCSGAQWSEGPVWLAAQDCVVWSDIPNDRMLRWSERDGLGVFRQPAHFSNGNYLDREGRLVSCEHGRRCISRTATDGRVEVLVCSYQGGRLNSPNDLVVKSDGSIWFSDPAYGIMSDREGYQAESEQDGCHVYRFDPQSRQLSRVADDFEKPNGLAFSPDESLLYVSDTSASHAADGCHHIRVFDVLDGRRLANGRLFAVIEPGLPDGFRVDRQGWLYVSSADSIQVFAPDGCRLGKIPVPEKLSNCTFGGAEGNRLFITASTSLYAITLNTRGCQS
ncbi:Gluconolactonase precursor [compost metagenome]